MMTKTCKRKLSATGNWLIFLKFPKLLERNKRKNLPSSRPKYIVSGRNGNKEELVNYASWGTKFQGMSEFSWGQIKLTSASWTTMPSKKTFSASSNSWKLVTIPGLGLPMTFLMKSQKVKNSVRNSPPNKSTNDLKYNSTKPSASTPRRWKSMRRSLLKRSLRQKLRRPNEAWSHLERLQTLVIRYLII